MSNELKHDWQTYRCATCRARFGTPPNETPVCCPVCRMNRVRQVGDE